MAPEVLPEGHRKYRTSGVLLATFPGFFVHGLGHGYAGDHVTGLTLLGLEVASVVAIVVASNKMPADPNARVPLWVDAASFGGLLVFTGTWLTDIFMTPFAVERWNLNHGYGHQRRSLLEVGVDAVKSVIGLPPPPPAVRPAAVSATGLVVAVAAFAAEGVGAGDAAVASDWVRAGLIQAGTVTVVERERMEAVLGEQAFQQTGCTREDCAVRLGRMINAQRIVVGRVTAFLGEFVVTVGVVDIETGRAVANDTARGRTADELEAALKSLSVRLASSLH